MRTLTITDHTDSMSSMIALVLFDSSVKAAVLLAIAFVSAWALRRASAAIRDRIWTLAFCGVMILPAISSIVPQWRIPVVGIGLPASTTTQAGTTDETATRTSLPDATEPNRYRAEINPDLVDVSESASVANHDVDASSVQGQRHSDQNDMAQTANASSGLAKVTDYVSMLLVLWLVGVVVLTVRFVMAVAITWKLISCGQQLTDRAATQLLDQTSIRLGLARRVKLLEADNKTIPMTLGIIRPAVVIPANWHTWPADRFRFVLLHELAHVKRWDVLFQSIARMACTVYWFNPLAWYALYRMRIDCELACDDQVIATGEGASTYAGELIQIARIYRPARFASGIAMSRSSKLDGRIVSLLDAKRPHGPVSQKAGRLLLTLSAGIVFVLAAMTVGKPVAVAVEPEVEKPAVKRAGANSDSPNLDKPNPNANVVLAKDTGEFDLSIVGPDGKPVPEASIELRTDPSPTAEQIRTGKIVNSEDKKTFITANSEGRFVIAFPKKPGGFDVRIVTAGYGPYRANWSSENDSQQVPAKFNVELEKGLSVGGIVVDVQGIPIQGVRIRPGIEFTNRPGDSTHERVGVTLTTDADGKWRFDSVKSSNPAFPAMYEHPDFIPIHHWARRNEVRPENSQDFTQKITLERGLTVTGKVTDETGKPIVGAKLFSWNVGGGLTVTTGNDGVYVLGGRQPKTIRIVVAAKGRAREAKSISVEPKMEPVNFELKPGGKVRVRVVDEMEKPIPKARLVFRGRHEDSLQPIDFENVNRYADDVGIWEWNEAPLDEFHADICRPNGLGLLMQSLKARDQEYVFRLPAKLAVVGKVIDAETKEPVKTFQVTTAYRGDQPSPRRRDSTIDRIIATDGNYRIQQTAAKNYEIADVIQIESDGYRSTTWHEIKYDAGSATIDFELSKVPNSTTSAILPNKTGADEPSKFEKTSEKANGILLPSPCETALKHNVQALKTCSFKYSTYRDLPPLPAGSPPRPERGANGPDGYCVLDGGQFYHRRILTNLPVRVRPDRAEKVQPNGKIGPSYEESSFDGRVFYVGATNRNMVTRFLGENADDKEAQITHVIEPYLLAAGFEVPRTIAEWRTSTVDSLVLKAVKEGKILKLTEEGAFLTLELEIPDQQVLDVRKMDLDEMEKKVEATGQRIQRSPQMKENLRRQSEALRKLREREPVRRVEFKLDREKGYALQRREDRTPDGKLIQSVNCEEFEFFPTTQLWLPRVCVSSTFATPHLRTFEETPVAVMKIKLDEISFVRPDDVSFKIVYGPGSIVRDSSTATPQPEAE